MPHLFLILALLGAVLGFTFAAVSSYDFIAHLDRQVHGLHCSFFPGLGGTDASGASGCHATMMSPYSSLFRDSVWGGVPITLPAMAVFAFLLFWGVLIWQSPRTHDSRATGFFAIASLLPVVASMGMATIAIRELDAFCKLCVGIYIASALTAVGAIGTYLRSSRYDGERPPLSYGALAVAFALGCAVVLTSAVAYALATPDFDRFVGSCGRLEKPADPNHVLLPVGHAQGSPLVLEVLDPLCPSCRAFERRFSRLELSKTSQRKLLLFPLDNTCNWMVDRALHPGACAISEALLCAGDRIDDVLAWSFDHQEEIIAAERASGGGAAAMVRKAFPRLNECIGSSKVRARLNKALRWAVENKLPVLTPQLYVDGARLCDADTDLGLDYMLTRLSRQHGAK